jgi:hypothetical protein
MPCVKSREIINMLFEQGGTFLLPILQGLDGRDVAQCTLRDGVIIESSVTKDRVFETLGRIEAMGRQDLADAAIEALDHAVGLGVSGLRVVLDTNVYISIFTRPESAIFQVWTTITSFLSHPLLWGSLLASRGEASVG